MTAVLAPEAIALQAGVALGVSAVGVVAGRPFVSRAIDLRRTGFAVRGARTALRSVIGTLLGAAQALRSVLDAAPAVPSANGS